ncbi:MAG: glycosyltransferase [Planctomycetota bacterium]
MSDSHPRSEPVRALFLALDPEDASARTRVRELLPHLASHGVAGELQAWPRARRARRELVAALPPHEVIVLVRVLPEEGTLVALRRAARALVLDLDDAVDRRPFRWRPSLRLGRRLARTARVADLVTCGSEHLRDRLARTHPRVRLLPPASTPPELPPRPDPPPLRLAWTGSRHTLPYLEDLGPVLADLCAARPEVELCVVADRPPSLPGVRLSFTPWSIAAEEEVLTRAHVGLYPLRDDAWSQGKCAYKVRRYMACGLPSIAVPWGGGAEALAPDEAGLLARDPREWRAALERLCGDPALRQRMGAQARALALARDTPEARALSLAAVLREAAAIGAARR